MRSVTLSFLRLCLAALFSFIPANAAPNPLEVTLRNELPDSVIIYWEGPEGRVDNGKVDSKGGQIVLSTYSGHRFSYAFGGLLYFVDIPDGVPHPFMVLLAGQSEIGVECTTTSEGSTGAVKKLVMRIIPWWSPRGASQFISLIRTGYYNGAALNRIVPGFLTQFGISADYRTRTDYRMAPILDDNVHNPPIQFHPGSLSYAGSGPDSRSTEVFIVMPGTRQEQLDYFGMNSWETPFGIIDNVHETVVKDWFAYGDMPPWGEGPDPQKMYMEDGYEYLKREFPRMDYIQECVVVEVSPQQDEL